MDGGDGALRRGRVPGGDRRCWGWQEGRRERPGSGWLRRWEAQWRAAFGLLGQAIVALGGSDVDDVVVLERLGGQSARFYRAFRWLAQAADDAPLLPALDDLRWSDPDSPELLGFLCRRLTGTRIAVLGALRPEPDPALTLAHELTGSDRARMLAVEPLSREASGTLIKRSLSRPLDAQESDDVWRARVGTPLLLDYASTPAARARFQETEQVCGNLLARTDVDPAARARALSLLARAASIASRLADAERLYGQAADAAALAGPEIEAATLADAAVTCQISSPVSWVRKIASRAISRTWRARANCSSASSSVRSGTVRRSWPMGWRSPMRMPLPGWSARSRRSSSLSAPVR